MTFDLITLISTMIISSAAGFMFSYMICKSDIEYMDSVAEHNQKTAMSYKEASLRVSEQNTELEAELGNIKNVLQDLLKGKDKED